MLGVCAFGVLFEMGQMRWCFKHLAYSLHSLHVAVLTYMIICVRTVMPLQRMCLVLGLRVVGVRMSMGLAQLRIRVFRTFERKTKHMYR